MWGAIAPAEMEKARKEQKQKKLENEALKKHNQIVAQHLDFITKGCRLVKIRGKAKKYTRHFRVDADHLGFGYKDSHKIRWLRNLFSDAKDMSKVPMTDLHEVRDGPLTDVFVKSMPKMPSVEEEQCFSMVIGEKHKTLDLVAPNKETKDSWLKGMKHLLKKRSEADLSTQTDLWMRSLFKLGDQNNDGALSLKEIVALLQHLNIEVDIETAKQVFEEADTDKTKNKKGEDSLNLEEFMVFYKIITSREEINDLFEQFNYEGKYLDPEELQDFFSLAQKQDLAIDQCERIIDEFEPCPNVKAQKMLGIDGFQALFSSPIMDIFNPSHRDIYQDMTQPLSHYFIDSSHNTYLTQDQLMGPSAVEAYIRALKRGCRCIELDCWDGDKDDPVIYHGYTLTSKILFKDVITAVNMYAFESSEYPVILSIENHCSVEQQTLMAQYMKEILGHQLLTEPLEEDCKALPSPEQLKKRIIIKGKKSRLFRDCLPLSPRSKAKRLPDVETEDGEEGYVSDEDEAAEIEDDDIDDEEVKKMSSSSKKKAEEKHKLSKELSDCVVICRSVGFKGFEHAMNNYDFRHMSSFGEKKAADLAEKSTKDWIVHNTVQLSRVYPAGRRTDSSNYEPMQMWLAGNQIVALNYQTPDDPMHVYKGMFIDNGGCGYILKPEFMRRADTKFKLQGPHDPRWKKELEITIISGYQLPKKKGDSKKSILDPYVKLDIITVPEETVSEKTKHIHNNGFHPVWNETFNFTVSVPDLTLVRFRVMDYEDSRSNKMVAQYCLPFNSIQTGMRTIHLKSKHGEPIWGAQLLVNTSIK